MKTKSLILIFILLLTFNVYSSTNFHHGIGAAAGFVTGYGLSYRFLTPENAWQITFAPYITSSFNVISLGFALIHTLYEADITDLFMYTGVHTLYNDSVYDKNNNPRTSIRINVGIGPGIRFKIFQHVIFDIMFGYAVYNEIDNPSSVNFTEEAGLFYYF